jgi:glutaminyl-peptide cyclotransferase
LAFQRSSFESAAPAKLRAKELAEVMRRIQKPLVAIHPSQHVILFAVVTLALLLAAVSGCDKSQPATPQTAAAASVSNAPQSAQIPQNREAPPAEQAGGFDGQRAYDHVARLVGIGPRPAGSDGIHRAQEYIHSELKSYGCAYEDDDFHADTPAGSVAMKNILAKIPGKSPNIIFLSTHYDTGAEGRVPRDKFLGADDSGSSTGMMLEMARILCKRQNAMSIWIAFFDGEEAYVKWNDTDSTFGSREMAAKLALSGDIKRIKAFLLADLVGGPNLRFKRESNSTKWLTDLVWSTATRLGYQNIFVPEEMEIQDDHIPFLHRNVPCVDVIDLEQPYWHTLEDSLDKIRARSLAVVGHVFLESIGEIEKRSAKPPAR